MWDNNQLDLFSGSLILACSLSGANFGFRLGYKEWFLAASFLFLFLFRRVRRLKEQLDRYFQFEMIGLTSEAVQ